MLTAPREKTPFKLPALLVPLLFCASATQAQEIEVSAAKEGGVYARGEKITWRLQVKGAKDQAAPVVEKISYVLKQGGLSEIGRGEITLKDNAGELQASLNTPDTLLAEFSADLGDAGKIKALAGAVVEPEKIAPSAPPPADFDEFWKAKLADLAAVAANPVLTPDEAGAEVDYWKIEMDNIRASKIRGQLARPKAKADAGAEAGKKLPALLVVQWAGVYGLDKSWATNWARRGWLTLNINAHDLPIDEAPEFYKAQSEGALRDYPGQGNDDREASYFLRMYLSCYRAAEYLASRDDWDGKNLVVMGTSQGGMQAIMTGGFHPKVSAVLANVPAGCDLTRPVVGGAAGWPQWYYKTGGKDAEKVRATSKYFDVMNFARRIKSPALISAGMIDVTCPPAGVIATFNQIPAPKELLVLEKSDHHGRGNAQAKFYSRSSAWLGAIAAGGEVPVAK
jgi:cephalosporin-C deacetylase-like acetyl esterase